MNRLEDRLRDAFGAAAETVRPDSVGGLQSRPRTSRTRRLAPLTVAAAVALVVVGTSVVASLAAAGGQHARSSSAGAGASSPAASAVPSRAILVVPMVTGMAASQAIATLHAVGLRISTTSDTVSTAQPGTVIIQDPASGTEVPVSAIVTLTISSGPSVTYTLAPSAPSRLVTLPPYAVTIRILRSWQRTRGLGSGVGYSGVSGWVQLQAVTDRAGLHAACTRVAAENVSGYARVPFIDYLRIDGRPGCQILAALVNRRTAIPLISALVEYRSPLSDGANFLLISGDPATMTGIIATIRLHR